MNEKFEIGEVAIYWNPQSKNHMAEVVIEGPLEISGYIDSFSGKAAQDIGHTVSGDDLVFGPFKLGGPVFAPLQFLRKKPRDDHRDVTTWSACVWTPRSINA